MFTNGPGDLGSNPGRVLPKTLKMVLDTFLLNTQQYKIRKVEQSRERSGPSPTHWCSSYCKGSLLVAFDLGRQLYYDRLIGQVGRVFANGPGELGSIPGRVILKTLKWYLVPPCLTLSNIRYVSWGNPEKGVAPFSTPRCYSYWKRSLLVANFTFYGNSIFNHLICGRIEIKFGYQRLQGASSKKFEKTSFYYLVLWETLTTSNYY